MIRDFPWRTFIASNGRRFGTAFGEALTTDTAEEKELLDCAYAGARTRFAHIFDADCLEADDAAPNAALADITPCPIIAALTRFLNSAEVIDLLSRITTPAKAGRVHARALRFRPGHFMAFRSGGVLTNREKKKRLGCFYLNLIPEWRPEWGGMLEFRTQKANIVQTVVPTFNSLAILPFPHGHWISPVAPFAGGPMLAVAGPIYSA